MQPPASAIFPPLLEIVGLGGRGGNPSNFALETGGAPKTNRTSDLPLRRGLLYPLSYRGVLPGAIIARGAGMLVSGTGRRVLPASHTTRVIAPRPGMT